MRCERCHDPLGQDSFGYWAHALSGREIGRAASLARNVSCSYCHVEHRGRSVRLAEVADTYCAECHFGELASHPEFKPLTEETQIDPGIRFAHDRHLLRIRNRTGLEREDACLTCHQPMRGGPDMEPISFGRHCSTCHTREGSLELVPPTRVEGDPMPLWGPSFATGLAAEPRLHKEPWVVEAANQLRRELDPEAHRSKREELQVQVQALREQLESYAPAAGLDEPSLRERERSLAAELEKVNTQEERDRVRKELARVTDERHLRTAGIPRPPRALVQRPLLAFRERLSQAEARLRALEAPAPLLEPAETQRKAKELEVLLGPCARCHVRPFAEAAPARRQLHAMFRHRPHVSVVDCTHCHVTVERSSASPELNVPGIDTCRGCHGRAAPSDCRVCHAFHPKNRARGGGGAPALSGQTVDVELPPVHPHLSAEPSLLFGAHRPVRSRGVILSTGRKIGPEKPAPHFTSSTLADAGHP